MNIQEMRDLPTYSRCNITVISSIEGIAAPSVFSYTSIFLPRTLLSFSPSHRHHFHNSPILHHHRVWCKLYSAIGSIGRSDHPFARNTLLLASRWGDPSQIGPHRSISFYRYLAPPSLDSLCNQYFEHIALGIFISSERPLSELIDILFPSVLLHTQVLSTGACPELRLTAPSPVPVDQVDPFRASDSPADRTRHSREIQSERESN